MRELNQVDNRWAYFSSSVSTSSDCRARIRAGPRPLARRISRYSSSSIMRMASVAGAMVKIIKAGEEEASTALAPQFIVNNLDEWYADLRSLRQMKPKLQMDVEEVDKLEAELDAYEKHYGRDIKLPKEVL